MARPFRVVAALLLPIALLVGCGDDDTAEDPETPATSDPSGSAEAGPHPCDLLTQEDVQRTLDAPVTPVPDDSADERTCVYEPGADAPTIRLVETTDAALAGDGEPIEVEGMTEASLAVDGRLATAFGRTETASYRLEVDAAGLGDPGRIATRLLPLVAS